MQFSKEEVISWKMAEQEALGVGPSTQVISKNQNQLFQNLPGNCSAQGSVW